MTVNKLLRPLYMTALALLLVVWAVLSWLLGSWRRALLVIVIAAVALGWWWWQRRGERAARPLRVATFNVRDLHWAAVESTCGGRSGRRLGFLHDRRRARLVEPPREYSVVSFASGI